MVEAVFCLRWGIFDDDILICENVKIDDPEEEKMLEDCMKEGLGKYILWKNKRDGDF